MAVTIEELREYMSVMMPKLNRKQRRKKIRNHKYTNKRKKK